MGVVFDITKEQLSELEILVEEGLKLASELDNYEDFEYVSGYIENTLKLITEAIKEYGGQDGIIDARDHSKSKRGTNLAINLALFPDLFFPFPDGDRGKYWEYHERCRLFTAKIFKQLKEEA